MRQDIIELMKKMDLDAVETQLALHCAPLLMGLKASNLFMIQNERAEAACKLLEKMQISCFYLFHGECKSVMLLYRFRLLYRFLFEESVQDMLNQFGYQQLSFQKLLCEFADRYTAYMEQKAEFPHEMGLFLGYPVEDVQGFIENGGKNFLYTGYWKVYQNLQEKIKLFRKFDLAKESLLYLAAHGKSIWEGCSAFGQPKEL